MKLESVLKSCCQSINIWRFEIDDLRVENIISLKDDDIHIWLIKWRNALSLIYSKWQIMSEGEREKVQRFRRYEDRMRCATGKIMSRIILARYTQLQEHIISIKEGRYGKPYLGNCILRKSIHYNVSHSEEMVLLAFTKLSSIGVDVEKMNEISDYIEIAKLFFAPEEYEAVSQDDTRETFYQYWTAKEAYVKALGEGLNRNLDTFKIWGDYVIEQSEILEKWRVVPVKMEKNYFANIAVRIR